MVGETNYWRQAQELLESVEEAEPLELALISAMLALSQEIDLLRCEVAALVELKRAEAKS